VTVYEPGLYRLILRSRKPSAERFRTWIVNEVLPCIRLHGCYPAPPVRPELPQGPSALSVFEAAVAALREQSQRTARVEAAQADQGARLARIEAVQGEAEVGLMVLPEADGHPPVPSYGALTEKRIRAFGIAKGIVPSHCYHAFYDQVDVRLHLRLGSQYRGGKLLRDWIDHYGPEIAGRVYNIACEMFPSGRERAALIACACAVSVAEAAVAAR
jgi:hypothetical protein